jgi:hypothetical protein
MSDKRYQEILRRIYAQQQISAPNDSLLAILDALNSSDMLQDILDKLRKIRQVYGTKIFQRDNWAGLLLWYPNKGYYGYQMLTIVGIWVIEHENETIMVQFGTRKTPYTAPVYNAEAYHKLIRKSYTTYYNDSGEPPSTPLFEIQYEPENRLEIRQQLENTITNWIKTVS